MRILHTSDWHLGVSQEQSPREEEHRLFLEWLVEQLIEHQADVLIHAGDAFHYVQPSARALKMYYEFLAQCAVKTNLRQIVVTGGNHDSPSRLDAPAAILSALKVHVVGGLMSDEDTWTRCLCPITSPAGHVEAVILAVPYVHESRLGVVTTGLSAVELRRELVERFGVMYARLADLAQATYPGVPLITTGHLTCYPDGLGSVEGDYFTPIHMIEALGSLPPSIFDPRFSYVALGHIHKMFEIPGPNAWYAGSPVPTDIIESRSPRYVLLVDVDPERPEAHAQVTPLRVPDYRAIFELSGPTELVYARLEALDWSQTLPPYLYVDMHVPAPMPDGVLQIEERLKRFERERRPRIVRYKETLLGVEDSPLDPELFRRMALAEMTPTEVFDKMYRLKHGAAPTPEILAAFSTLLVDDHQ